MQKRNRHTTSGRWTADKIKTARAHRAVSSLIAPLHPHPPPTETITYEYHCNYPTKYLYLYFNGLVTNGLIF